MMYIFSLVIVKCLCLSFAGYHVFVERYHDRVSVIMTVAPCWCVTALCPIRGQCSGHVTSIDQSQGSLAWPEPPEAMRTEASGSAPWGTFPHHPDFLHA